eukprot:3699302-Pyramimonas_sp.AAC.1
MFGNLTAAVSGELKATCNEYRLLERMNSVRNICTSGQHVTDISYNEYRLLERMNSAHEWTLKAPWWTFKCSNGGVACGRDRWRLRSTRRRATSQR